MRGFDEEDFREVGRIIAAALGPKADVAELHARVTTLCERRPLYPGFRGYPVYLADGEGG
jgi:glycine hydroxymethyltransferase